jgi:deoxyribonuclease V
LTGSPFRVPRTPAGAIKLQKEIAKQVTTHDDFVEGKVERVCGVDVSYGRDGMAYCAAVVMDLDFNIISQATTKSRVMQPYIPGLFILREAGPVLRTLKKLAGYDLVMVDGHGQLHPRRCGLACFVGVVLDIPAIGVAKSRLCGTVRPDGGVVLGGQVLGRIVNGQYVSVGHRTTLATAAELVSRLSKRTIPEPLRVADLLSKRKRREAERGRE